MVGEPGDPDPDQPQRPGAVAQRTVEERAGELADLGAVVGAHAERGRARADREVGVAELGRDRARGLLALAQVARRAGRPSRAARRGAARGRRCRARTSPRSRSRSARSRPRAGAGRSRAPARGRAARPCPAAAGAARASASAASAPIVSTPAGGEARFRAGTDPRQHPDRERRQERRLPPWAYDGEPARLAPVGGDLRHHLRAGDAERARRAASAPARRRGTASASARASSKAGAISPRSR